MGGGFVIQVTVLRVRRTGGQEAADRVLQSFRWADDWLAILAPLLVVATGIAMVIDTPAWRFSQVWIYLSLVLLVVYEALALTVGGRLYRRMTAAREDAAVAGPAFGDALGRYLGLGTVLVAFLVTVVVLMVLKPGL